MAIELERDTIRTSLRVAMRKHLARWHREGHMPEERVAEMMVEMLFATASFTEQDTPEAGVMIGLNMVKNWVDE